MLKVSKRILDVMSLPTAEVLVREYRYKWWMSCPHPQLRFRSSMLRIDIRIIYVIWF